jgi:AraC family transcriptional regulator
MFEAHGFSVREHQYQAYGRMGWHRHPESYICIVSRGGFIDRSASSSLAADAGSVLVRPGGDYHATACGQDGATCLKFELKAGWLAPRDADALFQDRLSLNRADLRLHGERIHKLMQINDSLPPAAALRTRLELESSVIDLLADLVPPHAHYREAHEDWLEKLRLAIVENPFQPWTNSLLASMVDRHPVHVSRAFRERYGEPMGTFFRRLRLERCRNLIADGHTNLAEVASAAGFADQSHFTREYKRAFGTTPGRERATSSDLESAKSVE